MPVPPAHPSFSRLLFVAGAMVWQNNGELRENDQRLKHLLIPEDMLGDELFQAYRSRPSQGEVINPPVNADVTVKGLAEALLYGHHR